MPKESVLPAGGALPDFSIQMRGYSKTEVSAYTGELRTEAQRLERDLAIVRSEIASVRQAAERVQLEAEKLRGRAAEQPATPITERMQSILRLAEEEAAQKVGDAQARVTEVRAATAGELDRIVGVARTKADLMIAEAEHDAEHAVATARAGSEELLADARGQSETELAEAHEQAELVLAEAHERAEIINGIVTERLAKLKRLREQSMTSLTQMSQSLAAIIDRDVSTGVLELVAAGVKAGVEAVRDDVAPLPPAEETTPDIGAELLLLLESVADRVSEPLRSQPSLEAGRQELSGQSLVSPLNLR